LPGLPVGQGWRTPPDQLSPAHPDRLGTAHRPPGAPSRPRKLL